MKIDSIRNKRLIWNTVTSLLCQITTVICGFMLPRLIIQSYGSEVNGLVSSITQFLHIIAFFELGVGAVVKSALYKPLVLKDNVLISQILKSAEKFFRKIAWILIIYILFLICFYPQLSEQSFEWSYSAILIIAMAISSFAQYYFGIVNQLFLTAAQQGYIYYGIQIITILLNTFTSVLLINCGASIQTVKMVTSLIYLLRPFVLKIYVDKTYKIDKNVEVFGEPIKQKWNGVAQHVAAIVLDSTDAIVLTMFASLTDVSIYQVYYLVINGVKQLLISMTQGIQSVFGELWSQNNIPELKKMYEWVEWCIHTMTVFLFGCTGILILPFIQVYTMGVSDINYIVPDFALIMVIAHGMHCLRLPYNNVILAVGHYKQTQNCYIISAIMNVLISIITVDNFGVVGVAIGTLVAMVYQTCWMAWYNSTYLIKKQFTCFGKQCIVDIISIVIIFMSTRVFIIDDISYYAWILLALKVLLIALFVIILINIIFYPKKMFSLWSRRKVLQVKKD